MNRPLVVLSSVSSDSHTWNLVYLQLLLEENGCAVVNLGATTPDDLVADALREHRPDALVIRLGQRPRCDRRCPGRAPARRRPGHRLRAGGHRRQSLGVAGALGLDAEAALLAAGFHAVLSDPVQPGRHDRGPRRRTASRAGQRLSHGVRRPELLRPPGGHAARDSSSSRGWAWPPRRRCAPACWRCVTCRRGRPGRSRWTAYTRVGDLAGARAALDQGSALNGYPLVSHGARVASSVAGAVAEDIPVQVRHGSSDPRAIFATMAEAGLFCSEGGPVSYCLPYGRTPLPVAVAAWAEGSEELAAAARAAGEVAHLETFGGCLLGQMCPPSLLVAISVLEALFFAQHGVGSVSLVYAQQTSHEQDVEALQALTTLAAEPASQRGDPPRRAVHLHGRLSHDRPRGAAAARPERRARRRRRGAAADRQDRGRGGADPIGRGQPAGAGARGRGRPGGVRRARRRRRAGGRLHRDPRGGADPRARHAQRVQQRRRGAGARVRQGAARRALLPARRQRGPDPQRDRRRRADRVGPHREDADRPHPPGHRPRGDLDGPARHAAPDRAARGRPRARIRRDRRWRTARALRAGAARGTTGAGGSRAGARHPPARRRRGRQRPHLAARPVRVAAHEHRGRRGDHVLRACRRRPRPRRCRPGTGRVVERGRPRARRAGRLRLPCAVRPLPRVRARLRRGGPAGRRAPAPPADPGARDAPARRAVAAAVRGRRRACPRTGSRCAPGTRDPPPRPTPDSCRRTRPPTSTSAGSAPVTWSGCAAWA
ncbi:hypothetical protein [Nocardioides convexus]|uniref:hypothetical protein n=1 Tax=Nocardioides convexus TaxID=2712224 RepID=UPI00241870C0|nr:hypothetical protein [Nocardioides convexus]